jgi:hypothetical protein
MLGIMNAPRQNGSRVLWQTEVPSGIVVTEMRDGAYVGRIMQASSLDGWEESAQTLRGAKMIHDCLVSMAMGAEVYGG